MPASQLSGHARVQQCWTRWPNECNIFVHTWEQKKCWMMLKTMFDGNQTSFNIIQHHATSCNMVAKRVQHVGFNNVGWCCIKQLPNIQCEYSVRTDWLNVSVLSTIFGNPSLLLFQIWYLANGIFRSLFPSTQGAVTRFNPYGFLLVPNEDDQDIASEL